MSYNKKLSLQLTLSAFMLFIIPLIGFILTLGFIRKQKKIPFFYISAFSFIVFLYIPPLGDLYRHHLEYINTPNIFINTKLDFFLYYNLFIFKKLGIPFYFIPPIYVSLSLYLYLKSFDLFYKIRGTKNLLLCIIIILLSVNYISIASGLRYGLAAAIVIYAYSHLIIKNNKLFSIILIIISTQIHFSTYLFLAPILLSSINLSKRLFFSLCILSLIFSNTAIPILNIITEKLNHGSSYISGVWSSSENNNLAGQARFFLNKLPFYIYFFIFFFIIKNNSNYKNNNILYWTILLCLVLSFSLSLFLRYSVVPSFIMLFLILSSQKITKNIFLCILLFSLLDFSIDTLYGYRRQIELGAMWESLYTPPLIKIYSINDDYKSMLSEVDSDGFWIYNKVNSN
ncbi:EpsG family protein [Moellerella wisconsensis]|uniref:EpsG family protein n=1 Tax=Moellerella wisconsensis TaxID=158849 RepID=UPI00240F48FD|nr:EpsG family protein [Moellerella wisconsensis]